MCHVFCSCVETPHLYLVEFLDSRVIQVGQNSFISATYFPVINCAACLVRSQICNRGIDPIILPVRKMRLLESSWQ